MTKRCSFETYRLHVGEWAELAAEARLDLVSVVADILTEATTASLPDPWQGDYSRERAEQWITDRDNESPTLLAIDRTGDPIGLVILFESDAGDSVDVRIGYVLAEAVWGQGYATELVRGLTEWARRQPLITTLTGGVEAGNNASARVLSKAGFTQVNSRSGEEIYQLRFKR